MDQSKSVLITLPPYQEGSVLISNGVSGLQITPSWILTHGTVLLSKIKKSPEILNFLKKLKPGKLTLVPSRVKLNFQILQTIYLSSSGEEKIREDRGYVEALWTCPLLADTLENQLENWDFEKLGKHGRLLLPIFLLIKLGNRESIEECGTRVSKVQRILSLLSNRVSRQLDRGCCVEIRSTPFGNPVLVDSVTRGVVSNIIGTKGCVILSDAAALPGSEGAPIYVIRRHNYKIICGIVIACLARCHGELADYTFAVYLSPCLQEILQNHSSNSIDCFDSNGVSGNLDKSVAVVRCGISWGTGILIDREIGLFITCSHVVAQSDNYDIRIVIRDKGFTSTTVAELIYKTSENNPYDVAVLKIKPENLKPSLRPIKLCESPISKGETVISVGFPFFSTVQPTITTGVVSNSNGCMLQTTCCVQSGASGGPIVRERTHEMLGMVVSNAISPNGSVLYTRLCMALPAAILKRPLEQYLTTRDPMVFQCLTTEDPIARKIWSMHSFIPSKI